MTQEDLRVIWGAVHGDPAWLSVLTSSTLFSEQDIAHIVAIDDANQDALRGLHDAWKKSKLSIPEVDKQWAAQRRLEYLKDALVTIKREVGDQRRRVAQRVMESDVVGELIAADKLDELIERAARLTRQVAIHETPRQHESEITDAEVALAREVRLDKFVEHKRGFVVCPFHKDTKPSMSIQKGFGYCFTCQESVNAIDWLMRVNGLDFVTAVKKLVRL